MAEGNRGGRKPGQGTTTPKCGAKLRKKDRTCRQDAGKNTDHYGIGRCWLHGGLSPVKHGLYSAVVKEQNRELVERMLAEPEELGSLAREIALAKVVVHELAEVTKGVTKGVTNGVAAVLREEDPALAGLRVLTEANRLVLVIEQLDRLSKIMERWEKIQESRAWRVTVKQLEEFVGRVFGVLSRHLTDPDRLRAAGRDLAALVPGGAVVPAVPRGGE